MNNSIERDACSNPKSPNCLSDWCNVTPLLFEQFLRKRTHRQRWDPDHGGEVILEVLCVSLKTFRESDPESAAALLEKWWGFIGFRSVHRLVFSQFGIEIPNSPRTAEFHCPASSTHCTND